MAAHRSKRRRFAPSIALVAGALSWLLTGAQFAEATPVTLSGRVGLIGVANLHFANSVCDNTGATVEITGDIDLGSAGFHTRISNNTKGTKSAYGDSVADVFVVPDANAAPIPKQPVRGGSGGNPYIWFDLAGDNEGPIFLGRCVQGVQVDLLNVLIEVPSFGTAIMQAMNCTKSATNLGIGHGNTQDAATGLLMFDNNFWKDVHPSDVDSSVRVDLLNPRSFTKGVGRYVTGAGGNPHIYGAWFRPDSDFVDAHGPLVDGSDPRDGNSDGYADLPDGRDDSNEQWGWDSAQSNGSGKDLYGSADDGWAPASETWVGRCKDLA